MKTISFAGFSAIVAAYIKDSGHNGDVLFLSFAADTKTHAKAIWAALSNANNRVQACTAIKIREDGKSNAIRLARNTKYRTENRSFCPECRHDLGGGKTPFNCPVCKAKVRGRPLTTQYTLIHPSLLAVNDKSRKPFFLIEKDGGMPATFYQRLKVALSVSTRAEWAEWLWEEGQKEVSYPYKNNKGSVGFGKNTPIRSRDANGVSCWAVEPDQWAWLEIVRQKLNLVTRLSKRGSGFGCSWTGGNGWEIRRGHDGWCAVYKDGELCQYQGKDAEGQPKALEMKDFNFKQALAHVAVHCHIRLTSEGDK